MIPEKHFFVNPLQIHDWDARLKHFPAATFFHSAAWARVLHATYGYQPIYLATGSSSHYTSILPIMEVDSWLTGRRGITLPFTDECEPLGTDNESLRRLFTAALAHARTRRWKYLECRGGRASLENAPASTSFYHHLLPLQTDETAAFLRFNSSVRKAVRKAERNELTIEFSQSPEAMQTFQKLLYLTRQRLGAPTQSSDFFTQIQRHVLAQKQGWVVLARFGQIPVAGAVYFHFGRSVIYKFGASNNTYQHLRANNLVMWHAIRHYSQAGFATFDFGRTSLHDEGLRRFKLSWGTQERAIDYVRYELPAECYVTAKDNAAGWHTPLFQRMPPFVSRLVGRVLYRHMA